MFIYLLVFRLFFFLIIEGSTCLGRLFERESIVFNYSGVTIDNYTIRKNVNVIPPQTHYCPSYCDQYGYFHPPQTCIQPPYCCQFVYVLKCCNQRQFAIEIDVNDNHNCAFKDSQSISTTTNNNQWKQAQPEPEKHDCPSHCDENGVLHPGVKCLVPKHCCEENGLLRCCVNNATVIDDSVKDGYNCAKEYWQLVLAICVPLATLSLIAFLAMTSYLMCRKRKERQSRCRQRTASGSDFSCSSWSESTVSPSNTIRGNPCRSPGCASGHNCSRRQRPLEIFVLGPSMPPPYIDKPPPYSAVCNGEPNAGYDTTDLDSLPDYESLGLNPLALLQSNVLTLSGSHLNESMDNSIYELNENNVDLENAQQMFEDVNVVSINNETSQTDIETETGDSPLQTPENNVNIIVNGGDGIDSNSQSDGGLVVQFHNSNLHTDS